MLLLTKGFKLSRYVKENLESDSFYHFEEGIEKALYNDFRDIVIQSSAYGAGGLGGAAAPPVGKKIVLFGQN